MLLLLTNDDGIYAPGLHALAKALEDRHRLVVVAPEHEASAVGHGITVNTPLRVREARRNGIFFGYSVNGTPADCVKIAVQQLMDSGPDMIISGINAGANVGVNVLYSGTVSAAIEGAFLGLRSIAVSLNDRVKPDFTAAASLIPGIVDFLERIPWRGGMAFNINIPALPPSEIRGIALVRQATVRFKDCYERRTDPRGHDYYWLAGEEDFDGDGERGTDVSALRNRMIAVTPIQYDLTCVRSLENLDPDDIPSVEDLTSG